MLCPFCQIVAGKSSCYKIYEDNLFFAFLDINPRTKGHVLVIPKNHIKWVYDVPQFDQYWQVVLKLTKVIQKALNPYFITYVTFGLEVSHAHVHIIPRYKDNLNHYLNKIKLTPQEFGKIQNKITSCF